ncbi:hypothetical protein KCU65_g229, partial [Aureobasidium melanogenum]
MLGKLLDVVDLTRQARDNAQRRVLGVVLGNRHVCSLHTLLKNIHDLRTVLNQESRSSTCCSNDEVSAAETESDTNGLSL